MGKLIPFATTVTVQVKTQKQVS